MPFERVKDNSIQPMACTGCGNVFDVKTKDLDSGKVNPFTLCIDCKSKQARFKI
jgi:predicted Zn-ribbon and HTH transcriptional regulator